MYYTYVLSDDKGKLYKGCTNNLQRRLLEHNSGQTITTRRMKGKLTIKYFEEFKTLNEALSREKYLKTAAGRRFLKKIVGL